MQLEEHTDIDLLITRYLSGKMDKESFAELKRWSLESESNRKYVRNKFGFLQELLILLCSLIKTRHFLYSSNVLSGLRRNKNRCSASHGRHLCGRRQLY